LFEGLKSGSFRRKLNTVVVCGNSTLFVMDGAMAENQLQSESGKGLDKQPGKTGANLPAKTTETGGDPYLVASGIFSPVKFMVDKHISRALSGNQVDTDLSGFSEKVPAIIAEIEKYFSIKFKPGEIFQAKTLVELAAQVEKKVIAAK